MTKELFRIADTLLDKFKDFDLTELQKVVQVAEDIGKSWSGSCLGYHSRVYYKDFLPVPPDARFNMEWGFVDENRNDTVGDWVEYDSTYIVSRIIERADNIEFDVCEEFASEVKECFIQSRDRLLSILSTVREQNIGDKIIEDGIDRIKKEEIYSAFDFAQQLIPPGQQMSRDLIAVQSGFQIPPHILIMAKAKSFLSVFHSCENLTKYTRHLAFHMENLVKKPRREEGIGRNIYIGHGPSKTWKDLKNFVQDQLHLPWDECSRMSEAGVTDIERLFMMLNEAAFAFLLVTTEDEQVDGKFQTRMKVVHEAGLFQGRIGFKKVIVLLEEGCEEFSTIAGLGQIRFPKGNIFAIFDDIRHTLKSENIAE